jgi:hypothetical protein
MLSKASLIAKATLTAIDTSYIADFAPNIFLCSLVLTLLTTPNIVNKFFALALIAI